VTSINDSRSHGIGVKWFAPRSPDRTAIPPDAQCARKTHSRHLLPPDSRRASARPDSSARGVRGGSRRKTAKKLGDGWMKAGWRSERSTSTSKSNPDVVRDLHAEGSGGNGRQHQGTCFPDSSAQDEIEEDAHRRCARVIIKEEAEKLVDPQNVNREAVDRVEQRA